MTYQLEVCIDNLESLPLAISGGATRIELCSSLALGGLTPSFGMMKLAKQLSTIPVYAMIRPRQGDFLFSQKELELMLVDVQSARQAGLDGIVIGILKQDGSINTEACRVLIQEADGMGVTFHRAIDHSSDYKQALEQIIELGCDRILTSGTASSVDKGLEELKEMHKIAAGRISIMAGAGLNHNNVAKVINETGITEVHLSGKSTRPSEMQTVSSANMGSADMDDFSIPVTSTQAIKQVSDELSKL